MDAFRLFRILLLLMLLLSAACSGRSSIPLGTIPIAEPPSPPAVVRTARALQAKALKDGDQIIKSGSDYQRCKRVVDRLTKAVGLPPGTWPLYIIDGSQIANAAAVNQTTIIVYTGLIRRLKGDDELATILAHEITHIIGKHAPDKDKGSKSTFIDLGGSIVGQFAAVGAAATGLSAESAQQLGGLAQKTTQVVGSGVILSYDRSMEYEADHVGLMIMAKAGYDPRAAIGLWQRSDEIFGGPGIMSISFLSTHPSSGNRADELKKALPAALKYYRQSSARKTAFGFDTK